LNCPVGDLRVKGIEKRGDLLDSPFDLLDETDVGDAKNDAAMREPFAVRLLGSRAIPVASSGDGAKASWYATFSK
jgi:hypothetical protein